ncbi:MAG: tRNA pseudouridine(55) synthase TruB [Olsenella sp.]|nr:tRNA pseudouridine(55) synthase TruB [Olsenella sp.]
MRRGKSGLNLLLGVDKPLGMTSHDVVTRVRRSLGEGRVGHAGTLDPAASGVMVVGVGQGTRLMGLLTAEEKTYVAEVSFGVETDTDDAEGRPVREAPVPAELADRAFAERTVASLVGRRSQVPPAYSAISVNGKRAYALARSGKEVELEPREIEVFSAQLVAVGPAEWTVTLRVSKGTYVRAIARDLGRALGTAAHLSNLRRTSSGRVDLTRCLTLEEVDALGAARVSERCLDPAAMLGLPHRELVGKEPTDVACGRRIEVGRVLGCDRAEEVALPEGGRVALCRADRLMGVWRRRGGMLCCDVNFPDGVEGVR